MVEAARQPDHPIRAMQTAAAETAVAGMAQAVGNEEAKGLLPLILCLVLAIWLSHVVHSRRMQYLTEATVSLLVGLLAGGAVTAYYVCWLGTKLPASIVDLDTEFFFDVLLPPILFHAGFSVKKKAFFRNFVTLALFGVVGTFITAALIALGTSHVLAAVGMKSNLVSNSLGLGTVLSSTDSVAALQALDQDSQPLLFSLVFGEGVVNDATAVVLLRAVQKISKSSQLSGDTLVLILLNFSRLFVLSLLLGAGVGLASAYLIKQSFVHHSTDREVTLVGLLGFTAFLLAEQLGLSGIFSVFFAGITMSHYTWHCLSPSAKVVTVYIFRIISFSSELFLFLYAGFSMWSTTLWSSEMAKTKVIMTAGTLAGCMVLLVLAARGVTLLALTLLANTWRPRGCKIGWGQGAVVWWAGSMRGAITVAMSFQQFGRQVGEEPIDSQIIIVAANTAVIFFTVVLGGITSSLVRWFLSGSDQPRRSSTLATMPSFASGASAPLLASALHWTHRSPIYKLWHKLDERWLYPLFGGRAPRGEFGCHSPPPSPGRQVIHDVLGPGILKRLTPAPAAPAADEQQQQLLGPARSSRHADAFPLWPAASDLRPEAADGGASGLGAGTVAHSMHPDAADMQASDALEELFTRDSSRMDTGASQQLDWDSAQFGEAAWLAAGAPSGRADLDAEEGGATPAPSQEQQVEQQQQPDRQPPRPHGDLLRQGPSPFQDVHDGSA